MFPTAALEDVAGAPVEVEVELAMALDLTLATVVLETMLVERVMLDVGMATVLEVVGIMVVEFRVADEDDMLLLLLLLLEAV